MTQGTPVSSEMAMPAAHRMYAFPAAPYAESMLPYSFSICHAVPKGPGQDSLSTHMNTHTHTDTAGNAIVYYLDLSVVVRSEIKHRDGPGTG